MLLRGYILYLMFLLCQSNSKAYHISYFKFYVWLKTTVVKNILDDEAIDLQIYLHYGIVVSTEIESFIYFCHFL